MNSILKRMSRGRGLLIAALAAVAGGAWGASTAHAAVIELINSSADAFLSANNGANNYGAAGALGVSASGLSKGEFQSVLQFNLAAAKSDLDTNFGAGNWQVTAITLKLTATPPNNAIFNGNLAGPSSTNINFAGTVNASWMVNDSWAEGSGTPASPGATGISFNTLAGFLSGSDESMGSFSFAGGTSGQVNYPLSISNGLLGDLSAGSIASIRLSPGDSQVGALFASRTGSGIPVLTITAQAVPEPASLLVLSAGMLLTLRARRRRNI